MKVITIRLNDDLVNKLDEVARKTLSSRSETIRSALAVYFSLLDNIGFYFKPSIGIKNLDLSFERNVANLDLGNFISIAVLNVSYGGVGEKEMDEKTDLVLVSEVMANQLFVESVCRFIEPKIILLSTGNDFDYSKKFFEIFSKSIERRVKVKTFLVEVEEVFNTFQSFFSANLIGLRDMSLKNIPQRGDSIYLWGKVVKKQIKLEDLPKPSDLLKIVEMVKSGIANAIFPVKIDGVENVARYAASIAGGKLELYQNPGGGPATSVLVCSKNDLEKFGCKKIGEII